MVQFSTSYLVKTCALFVFLCCFHLLSIFYCYLNRFGSLLMANPDLAHSVKTMSEPLTNPHKKYAKWQEASRKNVEHAFGVLQQKFQFLVRDVE
jgi:hypothetical protein